MDLYRYRSIKSAIRDIESGAFHFASKEELNDPMESYVSVYWKGDEAAWEGLFRNYICSCFYAIETYLLGQGEKVLWNETLLIDINAFNKWPIGRSFRTVGDTLLADGDIIRIVSVYGKNELKCSSKELHLILLFVHIKVLNICLDCFEKDGLIPKEEAYSILKRLNVRDLPQFPFENIKGFESDEKRWEFAIGTDNYINDIMELNMVNYGINKPGFVYGKEINEDDNIKRARQHRNWISLAVDFPKMYISQLKNMIYPSAYYVCFSGKNDDSAMWGNYADQHRGVCLVYEAIYDEGKQNAGYYQEGAAINPQKVVYGAEMIERNFFESFGRLTISQIQTWLTGKDGQLSKCYNVVQDEESIIEWRNKYREVYMAKIYRKMKEWSYEDEYRIHIENGLYEYEENDKNDEDGENVSRVSSNQAKRSRNIKYDKKLLKGVIFGIKTSENDKVNIVKALSSIDRLDNIEFYQADYDELKQKVVVRKKGGLWAKEDKKSLERASNS